MQVVELKTEHLSNPLGVDACQPRFSWKIKSDYKNVYQTSYQIMAYEDSKGERLVWDSGVVESEQSQNVRWNGPKLTSGEQIYWKVLVESGNGEQTERSESALNSFEMALLNTSDWKAEWIEPGEQADFLTFQPAPYLRKQFVVKPNLKKARIYQTAHGLYEFWLNGQNGTEDKFKPGFTSYHHRLQYQTYDVTELLHEGENVWGVALGDGWWRGSVGGMNRNGWGYTLQFLGQIVLTYADGSMEYICTDEDFKYAYGGIRECDLRSGEVYDASLEPEGWKHTDYDAKDWKKVLLVQGKNARKEQLIPSRSVPVLEREEFLPKTFKDKNNNLVLDFGQNIAGYVKMKLRGCKKGQKITLLHGEDLKDGVFSLENLLSEGMLSNDHFQQVDYFAKGETEEFYCPTFSVFGFRYVKLEGYDQEILPGDFVAVAVYSALEETGDFTCSNMLVNQLVKNSRWSQKDNYLDVPTDCPTRERSPWTGDSQVYCRTAANFMDVYPFFEKWMLDYNCDQLKNGKLRNVIPTCSGQNPEESERAKREFFKSIEGKEELSWMDTLFLQAYTNDSEDNGANDGSAGWSDAAVINPYTMYLCYGDLQIVQNQYDSAKKHIAYMFSHAKNANPNRTDEPEYHNWTDGELDADYIWDTEFHWGEWLETDVGSAIEVQRMMDKFTNPDPEVPTMFLYYSTRLVSEMADLLGKPEEADLYRAKAQKVKRMFNKYLIKENGVIKPGRQAPNVRALAFDLCDKTNRKIVLETLVQMVIDNDYHLNTGFLATPYILNVLADGGYPEIAYALLEQETSPSWLYNVKKGATTILEEWDGMDTHAGSFNHYSYGAVCDFLFTRAAGIQPVMQNPGYKEILIAPVIGGSFTYAEATYESIYGTIRSKWNKESDSVHYQIEIPVNTTAKVRIPAGENAWESFKEQREDAVYDEGYIEFCVGSGRWEFTI